MELAEDVEEFLNTIKLDIFDSVTVHYTRVCLHDTLTTIREAMPHTKKVALRKKVAALSERQDARPSMKSKKTTVHAYICPQYEKACLEAEDVPSAELSDICKRGGEGTPGEAVL